MRCIVFMKACFHWLAFSFNTRPERRAAAKTPVPAADSQLIVKRATSGFALTGATGGARCTRLWSAGMSHAGSERVPPKLEPRRVVVNLMPEKRLLRYFLNSGMPQIAQQATRIIQGSQA